MKVTNNAPPNPQIIEQTKSAEKSKVSEKAVGNVESTSPNTKSSLVNISEDAILVNKAIDLVKGAPDIRQEKVAALQKQIQAGEYQVDSADIADRLLAEHRNTDFGKNNL